MSTAKMVLVVLFLLVALGIVGRMDYEDAKRMERANIQDRIRLLCVRRVPITQQLALRSFRQASDITCALRASSTARTWCGLLSSPTKNPLEARNRLNASRVNRILWR